MSNQGNARSVQAQAYGKPSGGGPLTGLVAMGLIAIGFVAAVLATATAVMTTAPEALKPVIDGIDRLGLDKGPLALYGTLMIGVGFALMRLGSMTGGSAEAARAAAFAEQTAGDLEGQSAIVASLQAELGALRHDVAEARRELHEVHVQTMPDAGETASDPIFRLAASLDQLGARVDKRIDGTRTEMLEAVEKMSKTMSEVTTEQTEAAREQRAEFEGLRMDMVDLHAEIARVSDGVSATKNAIGPARVPADPPSADPAEFANTAAPLPRELSEKEPKSLSMSDEPSSPLPVEPERRAAEPAESTKEEFDFPSPPPPIPSPSEGLDLLDDMEDDVARDSDKAPPLFPDLDAGGF